MEALIKPQKKSQKYFEYSCSFRLVFRTNMQFKFFCLTSTTNVLRIALVRCSRRIHYITKIYFDVLMLSDDSVQISLISTCRIIISRLRFQIYYQIWEFLQPTSTTGSPFKPLAARKTRLRHSEHAAGWMHRAARRRSRTWGKENNALTPRGDEHY